MLLINYLETAIPRLKKRLHNSSIKTIALLVSKWLQMHEKLY